MAAVSLSPAQCKLGSMTSRRIPLGNVPNAANSPFRGAPKRTRDQVDAQAEFPWDIQPIAKRQALDLRKPTKGTPPRRLGLPSAEGRVFNNKRPDGTPPTAFERQLLAVKESKSQQRVERQDRNTQQTAKGIKQWQEHYKRAFPSFVFYFENIGEEVRIRCSKYARSLGAREEKFFSKDVTHVITLREIPTDADTGDAANTASVSTTPTESKPSDIPHTIDPSVLDEENDHHTPQNVPGGKSLFEAMASRRAPVSNVRDIEQRRNHVNSVDILVKAKEMGIKVWQLEKFQRMIRTMLETPIENQPQQNARSRMSAAPMKGQREPELSRMLRNERINGPSDRDSTVALNEMVLFKGPYIYIRDMDERTKPIMVRDYAKPLKGEMGDWPQFQGVSAGRCPFVPEVAKEDLDKVKARKEDIQAQEEAESRSAPVTRSAVQQNDMQSAVSTGMSRRPPLRESNTTTNVPRLPPPSPQKASVREFCPPPPMTANKSLSSAQFQQVVQAQARPSQALFGGEPAASGLHQSNITSAIRSQIISSTAAQPGAKAGTSKEVHGLKRKVLEKNTAPGLTNAQTRHVTADSATVMRAEKAIPIARKTRQQVQQYAQQKLNHQGEESTESEAEDVWLAEGVRKTDRPVKKSSAGKEAKVGLKPGYCENCREKYEDFDDHILGRKHRKFALTRENWADLDRLLSHLGRRLKESDSDSF